MTEAFVNPELLGWHRSALALLMIVLGGVGSLHGPILGALGFAVLGEVAGLVTERQHLVEGIVILLVVLALPQGLASANSYEFFDSVSWMLEAQSDWNQYGSAGFGAEFNP